MKTEFALCDVQQIHERHVCRDDRICSVIVRVTLSLQASSLSSNSSSCSSSAGSELISILPFFVVIV